MLEKLLRVVDFVRRKIDREMPIQQLLIFLIIGKQEHIGSFYLAQAAEVNRVSLSRNIDRLRIKHGLISKELNQVAGKGLVYRLTEKGKEVHSEINQIMQA